MRVMNRFFWLYSHQRFTILRPHFVICWYYDMVCLQVWKWHSHHKMSLFITKRDIYAKQNNFQVYINKNCWIIIIFLTIYLVWLPKILMIQIKDSYKNMFVRITFYDVIVLNNGSPELSRIMASYKQRKKS